MRPRAFRRPIAAVTMLLLLQLTLLRGVMACVPEPGVAPVAAIVAASPAASPAGPPPGHHATAAGDAHQHHAPAADAAGAHDEHAAPPADGAPHAQQCLAMTACALLALPVPTPADAGPVDAASAPVRRAPVLLAGLATAPEPPPPRA